jgi:hypothetical protein
VEAWLTLAILCAFGSDWIDLGGVKDFAALVTLLIVALAYVLGILADRAADSLFKLFENDDSEARERLSWMRMTVIHSSDGMSRFLDYQRSRWRIARATFANLLITGPLAALYLVVRTDEDPWAIGALVCWTVLIPATYFIAVQIRDAWVKRLRDAYKIVKAERAT